MREWTFADRWEEFQERWDTFRPSRPLWLWSSIGAAALTVAAGFTFCGWTTREAAEEMARRAAGDARAQLVAMACVRRFSESANFEFELSMLKDATASSRPDMLEKGGWVTLAGMDEPLAAAAVLCADQLAAMPDPSSPVASSSGQPST